MPRNDQMKRMRKAFRRLWLRNCALPAQHDEDDVPEPDGEVDLVVDHVDAQDTEGVETLQTSSGAETVEGALCQPWKYLSKRAGVGENAFFPESSWQQRQTVTNSEENIVRVMSM